MLRRLLCALAVLAAGVCPAAAEPYVITDQSAATLTATVTGTARLVDGYHEANVWIYVTAASGSPTLDVAIQTAPDDDGPWATLSSFTQITGTGTSLKTASANIGPWMRLLYTVGGSSPSLTLSSYIALKK